MNKAIRMHDVLTSRSRTAGRRERVELVRSPRSFGGDDLQMEMLAEGRYSDA